MIKLSWSWMGRSEKKGPIRPLRLALQHFPLVSPPFSPIQPALTIYRTPYTLRTHIQDTISSLVSCLVSTCSGSAPMTKGEKGEKHCTRSHSPSFTGWAEKKKIKTTAKEKKGGKRASPLPSPIFSGPGAGDHYP